jgi:hypothetical protein
MWAKFGVLYVEASDTYSNQLIKVVLLNQRAIAIKNIFLINLN